MLREKSALERQHDALNEMADLMQRYDDRLTLQGRDFAERYIDGRLTVVLNGRSRRHCDKFHLLIAGVGPEEHSDDPMIEFEEGLVPGRGNQVIAWIGHHMAAVPITEANNVAVPDDDRLDIDLCFDHDWLHRNSMPLVSCIVMHGPQVLVPSRVGFGLLDEVNCSFRE